MENVAEAVTKKQVLNAEQEEAANHVHGPCFVCACPGSGKTRVIVERAIRLIEKGISPKSLLCITFTNKAATEMKDRITKRLGKSLADEIYISTFHALCATIIRKHGGILGYGPRTNILDDDDQEGLMAQCVRQAGLEMNSSQIKALIYTCNDLREKLIPESDFAENFKQNYEADVVLDYMSRLRKNSLIDFSGLLSETVRLLETHPDVLATLQSRFDFIQVDEAQDTNYAQFKIVQLIGSHNNVLVVGDPDQGIYSWRGARYQNIEDFVNINKAKVISLPQNYRSTPEIVKAASVLIQNNPNRRQTMEFKTSNTSGKDVEVYAVGSPEMEGMWIGQQIKLMIDTEGYKPHDFAVLYRLNAMSRAIEQGMIAAGLAYQVIGGFSFFDRAEVKDSLALLRFLVNPNDGTALARFINKPGRTIGETTLGKIENFANDNGISLIEAMNRSGEYITSGANHAKIVESAKEVAAMFTFDQTGKSIGEILALLLRKLQYRKYMESKYDAKELQDRAENVQELINSCALYSEKRGSDIGAYLNNIALQSPTDKETKQDMVSLMSLHASKGLEFPVVFLPCMEDGQFPHKRAIVERNGLEEERRLAYVGMTRAEKVLMISYPMSRMQRYAAGGVRFDRSIPSRFLKEAGFTSAIKVPDINVRR